VAACHAGARGVEIIPLLPGERTTLAKAFLQRLHDFGYDEGKNLLFAYRSAEGRAERVPELAAELVHDNPDVLVAGFGTVAAKAARAATSRIPIVFTGVGDPVGAGLVASLNRPGANITGMSAQAAELSAKRLQLLNDLVPGKKLFAVLGNPDTPFTASALQEIKTAAAAQGQPFAVFEARNPSQLPTAIDAVARSGAASLLVLEDPMLLGAPRIHRPCCQRPAACNLYAA
jgi:putative tryptophan/tyrosine transport system substrate-binding protein